jgi:hypothetical protein
MFQMFDALVAVDGARYWFKIMNAKPYGKL